MSNKDLPASAFPNNEGFYSPSFLGPKRLDEPFPNKGLDYPEPPKRGPADVVLPNIPPPVFDEKIDPAFDPNKEVLSPSFDPEKLNKGVFAFLSV